MPLARDLNPPLPAGFSLAGGAVAATAAFLASFAVYRITVVPREEKLMEDKYGAVYRRYMCVSGLECGLGACCCGHPFHRKGRMCCCVDGEDGMNTAAKWVGRRSVGAATGGGG